MITWDLFESQFDLDDYLKDIGDTLHQPEKEITFPCWGFTFIYYDQSHGVEIVAKTDLERMMLVLTTE